jgi:circadian clock protein KaiB
MTELVKYRFRLYIAGNTPNSAEALANLHAICDRCLRGRHLIEIIDVARDPDRALADGIRMTPSLVKLAPAPFRKIVGTLAHTKRVLLALDVTDLQPPEAVPLIAEK